MASLVIKWNLLALIIHGACFIYGWHRFYYWKVNFYKTKKENFRLLVLFSALLFIGYSTTLLCIFDIFIKTFFDIGVAVTLFPLTGAYIWMVLSHPVFTQIHHSENETYDMNYLM